MQEIGVFILFIGAVSSLGWELFKIFRPAKNGCAGCSSCGVDFDAIEKKIEKELK
jgi:hypothetical protein